MDITFVTGNEKKVAELNRILGAQFAHKKIDVPEIQSLDLEEVVIAKAKAAYAVLGTPVLVEDTALTFTALGKLPGTFIKFFAEELEYAGLCDLLAGKKDRSAVVRACIALYDGEAMKTFMGECDGTIAYLPHQGEGFGFDCIFIPEGYSKTWSEMDNEVKDQMSHRSRALQKLALYLEGDM